MPRFFYALVFSSLIVWTCLIFVGSTYAPDTIVTILMFLILVFFALGLTFSTFIFLVFRRQRLELSGSKRVSVRSLKYGFFLGFWATGSLGLKAFELITPVNYGLYLIFCLLIYFQLKSLRV